MKAKDNTKDTTRRDMPNIDTTRLEVLYKIWHDENMGWALNTPPEIKLLCAIYLPDKVTL